MTRPLSQMPALRLLVPFVLGIIMANMGLGTIPTMGLYLVGLVVIVGLRLAGRDPLVGWKMRPIWGCAVALLSIAAGSTAMNLWFPASLDLNTINGRVASAEIADIEFRDFSMCIDAKLVAADGGKFAPHHVVIYTTGCDYSLNEGDVICFKCDLAPIVNPGNPDEHDRRHYMWQRGIMYQQHLTLQQMQVVGYHRSLHSFAAGCRHLLEQKMMCTTLSPDARNMLIAILLGSRNFIDSGMKESFSSTGIAHVLALSGLHVGLIACLIWFLLFPLDYLGLKKLRLVITLAALLCYAMVTGLGASVVRATIMISLTLAAVVLQRKSSGLNALCVSALVTLTIWPAAIWEAGFQLSYSTVAFILLFSQNYALPRRFNGPIKYVAQLLLTSLVALVATVILNAYYYNVITPLSCLTNMLILPVMPVLMSLGVIAMFLAAIDTELATVNYWIELITSYMSQVSDALSHLPWMKVSGVYVTAGDVILFYLATGLIVCWLLTRRARWLILALVPLAGFALHCSLTGLQVPAGDLIVLNDYRGTPLLWHDHDQGYVWLPDVSEADHDRLETSLRRFMAHRGIDRLAWAEDDALPANNFVSPPFAYVSNARIMIADKKIEEMLLASTHEPIHVDLLVVTKRYHGNLSELLHHVGCRQVILSGALSDEQKHNMRNQCDSLSVPCHVLGEQGAWMASEIQ